MIRRLRRAAAEPDAGPTPPIAVAPGTGGDAATEPAEHQALTRIRAVTDAALSTLHPDDLLAELLERTRRLLDADTATILLIDPAGRELFTAATVGLEEEVQLDIRVPLGIGFAGRVAATAEPLVLERVDRGSVYSEILFDHHLTSMAGVPMFVAGQVIGVLRVGTVRARQFTEEDIELLRLVADRASIAGQARLSQMERTATLALQRSLLPARPPAVPGLDVAARYVPAAEVGVGGDWYDVFLLPSDHVGLVIGDVAGHGLRAAVVMGRIRSALRAYALESDDPADVLTRLDRKIQLFEPGAMATAVYAVLDPARRTAAVSVAGHPQPILLRPGCRGRLLTAPIDLPLGAIPDTPRHTTDVPVTIGSGLMLYTDGLVERRYRPIDDGLAALLDSLTADGTDVPHPEWLCTAATSALLHNAAGADDVAVLAARLTQ
ncbi:MAG: SpoIIE family protein phosphatase [Hamadaea sp.]|nr:SpoIIE family protein phosphatase [Hamadaea sp.]